MASKRLVMSTSRDALIAGRRGRSWSSSTRSWQQRPQVEVSAALLAEARMALDEALESQQHGWRALWHDGLPMLRFQPASGFALALTLILCGFGLGWGLRPHAGRLTSGVAGVNNASVASPDLENMRISGISRVAPDPQTGGVKITMDAERRVTLEGSLDDPKIQQVLVYAVKSYDNPASAATPSTPCAPTPTIPTFARR